MTTPSQLAYYGAIGGLLAPTLLTLLAFTLQLWDLHTRAQWKDDATTTAKARTFLRIAPRYINDRMDWWVFVKGVPKVALLGFTSVVLVGVLLTGIAEVFG